MLLHLLRRGSCYQIPQAANPHLHDHVAVFCVQKQQKVTGAE
jgi:hypothetical protein